MFPPLSANALLLNDSSQPAVHLLATRSGTAPSKARLEAVRERKETRMGDRERETGVGKNSAGEEEGKKEKKKKKKTEIHKDGRSRRRTAFAERRRQGRANKRCRINGLPLSRSIFFFFLFSFVPGKSGMNAGGAAYSGSALPTKKKRWTDRFTSLFMRVRMHCGSPD